LNPKELLSFSVDNNYIKNPNFCDLPILAFETVEDKYPPDENDFFIALSYAKLNLIRKEKFLAAKKKGYKLASFLSSYATILTDESIGENCFILENNVIQPFVKIGNNVTLWSGNHIGHHSTLHDHTFIASQVVVSGGVEIGEQCFIGVNATLRDHIKIGDRCVIGAGSILLGDTAPNGVYMGSATERSIVPSTRLRGL
jgi:sugar O-acyltransferase (sialic acid O-acetyltransferase NeuD family)